MSVMIPINKVGIRKCVMRKNENKSVLMLAKQGLMMQRECETGRDDSRKL